MSTLRLTFYGRKTILVFMSGKEAISIIQSLGISQARFARIARLHPNAITKWANGTPPSGPVSVLLLLLRERPELVQVAERV